MLDRVIITNTEAEKKKKKRSRTTLDRVIKLDTVKPKLETELDTSKYHYDQAT